ncbi:hypothetical protein OEZ85_013431 [Tetradesmus obliquus]|uniref:FAD dependent oxidoreductase domain-containing protein n=1 Tax=Tetradesmus obliquus TaxID=3088 RepID=A0ABY8U5P6_TETOB|nr:hypothetical protein OEZ85_013431 [Tetradesmus obliquus]
MQTVSVRSTSRATTKVNFKDTDAVDEFLQSIPEADQAVLHRAAAAWQRLCTQGPPAPPHVATSRPGLAPKGAASDAYDVVVLGGTLGILLATALLAQQQQQPGAAPLRVAVVERGKLQGRQQEWNASHSDLQVLVELGLLQPHEVEEAVATRFSSVRVGVAGRAELSLQGVMDCGVCPATLLALLARRFTALGGVLLEDTAFSQLDVYDDTALLILAPAAAQQQQQHAAAAAPNNSSEAGGAGGRGAAFELPTAAERTPAGSSGSAGSSSSSSSAVVVSARLVLDALGGLSPLSAQARAGSRPEAAMLLVGSCVEGPGQQAASSSSSSADVLWGWTPLDRAACQQYWWERFPAQGGAATSSYMFAFTDPDAANAGLLQHMARQYAAQLPTYLGVPPGSLAVQRGVFGVVPCYSSRTPPLVDRLLPVADAAGNRSALSLAGFCALLRHLPRLTGGIREALAAGALSKQELGLLQPWCPGVAASTAMQRTMAVYSCQAPTIRGSSSSSSAQPGRSSSNSSAAVSGSEVLDMMGASFSAMWGAVGAAGMAPFVADRLQWGPLAAGMAAQARADLPQLLSYSRFLNDTRSAPRLLAGLAGLAAYSALHAATPLTGPLHEALLSRLSPRLLYAWHRYADAWRYGSGADWAPAAAAAAAADTGAAPSGARDVTHSVDTYEDSLLPPGGYEGADADDALCRPDSPLCEDPGHSVDSTDVIDWGLEAGQGWGQHSSGSRSGSGVAAACSSGCSSGSSRPASKQAAVWGGSVLPAVHCSSSSSRSQMLRARPVAMAASNGSSSSSGDSGSSSGGDKNAALHRQQRRALEQLLLSIVVHEEHGRHQSTGESRDVVSIAEPGPGGDVSHYEGADAARLLYPQLDPARSYDEYDVIDWSDVANDGWGSSSTSGSGGSRRQCCNTRPAGSSSSSRMNPVAWGGSMCRAGWLPETTSSRQQQRRVAAAAAAGGAGGNSNAAHSVDTYEDSLLPPGGYEGADAADDALCRPDSPLCEDPGHSVDSTEVINWEREAGQGSTSSTRAAAAAASASNRSAAKDASHSVDTYEDSLLPPGGYEGADADDALCRPDSPLCEDPGHSVDSTEVIDWADEPSSSRGQQQEAATSAAAAGSASSSSTAAAAEPGTASATSSLPADPSYRKKHDGGQQQQQQVAAPRPWMNIVGGRWVPPSREESEAMMRGSVEVGPDEGV